MTLIKMLLKEMDAEFATTKKMLTCIPNDKYDWKPHPKSMSVKTLSTHIAELPSWVTLALTTDGLDFAKETYKPHPIGSTSELLDYAEKNYQDGKAHLEKAVEADLLPDWTLRSGDQIFSVATKGETIRHAYSQIVHHRAQLGVFLRLLDIPIPGSYGPSADEMGMA